jgi:UDP-N-acetylmuramate--alanine ligase
MSQRPASIPERVHVIGIAGRHMSAIARVLQAWGGTVTGSDQRSTFMTENLIAEGIAVMIGHNAENIGDAELIAYSSAVKPGHVELLEAERRGIPAIKRHDMVARMMEGYRSIAVTGTHGKTTTSGLMAHILVEAGEDPTYLIGGEVRSLGTNAGIGRGRYFVVEADEYDYAFLAYHPDVAVVTNIEPDHLDLFGTAERIEDAFRKFMSQVKPDGHLITCKHQERLLEILETKTVIAEDRQTYGLEPGGDWRASNVVQVGAAQTFEVQHRGAALGTFSTTLPGRHNVCNALAGVAAGTAIGLSPETLRRAIASFRGAKRRFEPVGEAAGVTLMDDYAHHPTEVRATVQSARERFGRRRLVFLFQPNTFSRNQYLFEEWKTTFDDVDVLYLAPTFGMGRETPEHGLTSEALAEVIVGPQVDLSETFEDAVERTAAGLRPGDVFFTVGSGDIDRAGPLILEKLRGRA